MEKVEFIEKFKARTKQLSIDVIKFYDQMNKTDSVRIIGKQLIRSVTSTAANYRAACISRSQAEFFAKMSIVTEEADETIYWLEVLRDTNLASEESINPLLQEAIEISKVVSRARKNVKR